MADYKALYLDMVRASEEAVRTLIAAQQRCEERILQESDAPPLLFPLPKKNQDRT